MEGKNTKNVDVLVVGAGLSGLACAITAKKDYPKLKVCVLDKSSIPGGCNLSGAAVSAKPIQDLLNMTVKDWQQAPIVRDVLHRRVTNEQLYFLSENKEMKITSVLKAAAKSHLAPINPFSKGCYIVSVSKLVHLLAFIAKSIGVEFLWGTSADEIEYNSHTAVGVRLTADSPEPSTINSEATNAPVIGADFIVLAEGCDGFVTEKFVVRNGLVRKQQPLFSVGVKEVLKVSANQFNAFGSGSILRFCGYPFWRPLRSPSILGCGLLYPADNRQIAVTAITSLNWSYCDFTPLNVLELLKEHPFVSKFVMDGKPVEAGVKMIPQGGYHSIPKDPRTGAIGSSNVAIVGDGACLFNLCRFKGADNAIISGVSAGVAVGNIQNKNLYASQYTDIIENSGLLTNLKRVCCYRQLCAKAGVDLGLLMGKARSLLPFQPAAPDALAMTGKHYPYRPQFPIKGSDFAARAGANKSAAKANIYIKDLDICKWDCLRRYDSPCVKFCPGGVFKKVGEHVQPTSPENCLHCKICVRKCPYENISWTMPETKGGPRYQIS